MGICDVASQRFPLWPPMTVERYAALEQATGVSLYRHENLWWRRVRPFFYRPLLPFKKYNVKDASASFGRLGVFQNVVGDGQPHNSYLNPVVFDDIRCYDMNSLCKYVRQRIRNAHRHEIKVVPCLDQKDFCEKGFPVYLSFYKRTRYEFNIGRRHRQQFDKWVSCLFSFPEVVILGAYAGQDLLSFHVSCLVEDVLVLKTLANSTKGLEINSSDLLLDYLRASARDQQEINVIYDGSFHDSGVVRFKLLRGATVLALPAFLHLHPAALWLINKTNEGISRQLQGFSDREVKTACDKLLLKTKP
jgi:hypothetical protein